MRKRVFRGSVPRGTTIRVRDMVRDLAPEDGVMVVEADSVWPAPIVEANAGGEGSGDRPTGEPTGSLVGEVRDPEEVRRFRRAFGISKPDHHDQDASG